jgi:colanic acid/amylovoran biosynthesis protein
MKILIIEAYSAANIGSGALVENSIRLLQKNFPEAGIEVLAQAPESIHKLTGLPCYHELISLPLGRSRLKQIFWLFKTGLWMSFHALAVLMKAINISIPETLYTYNTETLTAVKKVKEADIVVSVGAERINDNFYKAILFSLYMLWMVKTFKKFLILFPQTIGPFHFKLTRFLSSRILSKCDVIFLRDRKSNEVIKEIGVNGPIIVDSCDVAVAQPAVAPEEARNLLMEFNLKTGDKPLVGMSVMQWSYAKVKGPSGYEAYKKAVATVADEFIENKGVQVLFIATNLLTEGCREDDVAVAEDIMAIMKHREGATLLNRVYTPSQMKGLMGLLELCLVTRMHACIFSTGIFTPTVSINYQFKLKEYMNLTGLGDYTVNIDVVTTENLRKLMNRAWQDRLENREVLKTSITSLAAQLEQEMQYLASHYAQKMAMA